MNHTTPLYAPWGVVTPAFWRGSAPAGTQPIAWGGPPEHLRARISTLHDVEVTEGAAAALAHTTALDADTTAEFGEHHVYTARVREIRAHLVLRTGDRVTALAWHLHVAQLFAAVLGPTHPNVETAVGRCLAVWGATPDETRRAVMREDLLRVLTDLHKTGSTLTRQTRHPGEA